MIAIARISGSVQYNAGNEEQQVLIDAPNLNFSENMNWNASKVNGFNAVVIQFEHNGNLYSSLWEGPHSINSNDYYIVDAPKETLQFIRDQLGGEDEIRPLIKALRLRPGLRTWIKNSGYRIVRNSSGNPITVMPKITMSGRRALDLDGEDADTAQELLDLD